MRAFPILVFMLPLFMYENALVVGATYLLS